MFQITTKSSPQEISDYIKTLREQKGKEKGALKVISEALSFGHNFVINLFWEEALTYQHMVMNDPTDKKSIAKMEGSILIAKFYIEKYKLIKWKSRLFRFLGRVGDYRGEFKKSVLNYKKALLFSKLDPEPYRSLEIKGFLSFALIMSGNVSEGYKLSIRLFNEFDDKSQGKKLKKDDYQTWAIWRSGIVIRTIEAFLNKKLNFDRKEFEKWITVTERDLAKGSFPYREMELKSLKQRLLKN